jgi:hypothetical protein
MGIKESAPGINLDAIVCRFPSRINVSLGDYTVGFQIRLKSMLCTSRLRTPADGYNNKYQQIGHHPNPESIRPNSH